MNKILEQPASKIAAPKKSTTLPSLIFVHEHFYPEMAGAAVQLTSLATGLAAEGMQIEVYTGSPSYGSEIEVPAEEAYQGVLIHRLPKTRFNKNRLLGRLANALSFVTVLFLNS